MDYPFTRLVYSGALAALARCARLRVPRSSSPTAMQSSSGLKVRAAGLWEAVSGRVLIYVHKERMLAMSHSTTPARTTCWWTTRCASSPR